MAAVVHRKILFSIVLVDITIEAAANARTVNIFVHRYWFNNQQKQDKFFVILKNYLEDQNLRN